MVVGYGIDLENLGEVFIGDTLILNIDTDIWDVSEAHNIAKIIFKAFPNNRVIVTLKGVELKVDEN